MKLCLLPLVTVGWTLASAVSDTDLAADDECAEGSCSLEAVQLRANSSKENLGLVHSLFTFGAVATASSEAPLLDLSHWDGSFRGLRCYTETIAGLSRQTDIAAIFKLNMYHAQMPTLALHWQKDSEYYPGSGRPELPNYNDARVGDVGLHDMKNYIDRLTHLQLAGGQDFAQQEPFLLVTKLAYLAWGAYEQQTMWRSGKEVTMQDLIRDRLPQWRLVAQTQQNTIEAIDNIFIVQNEQSLDCALAFQGTHSPQELMGNMKGPGNGYCGFMGVHQGYADKLWWLMKYSMPRLRPYLKKCNEVICTGHSLGGSVCEVFAACANSRRHGHRHYEIQKFYKERPELMPAISQDELSWVR